MSLLELNIMKKKRINETLTKPERKFETGDNKEYKFKVIINSIMYDKEADNQMPGLYFLVL